MGIGIEKIYTNIITTQSGEVPCAGENGELGKFALLSDIPKYYKELQNQINSICITGSFTPLITTSNISGQILNKIDENNLQISETINKLTNDLKTIENKTITLDEITKLLNSNLNLISNKLDDHHLNITEITKECENIKQIKLDDIETNKKIENINKEIQNINNNYLFLINNNENTTNSIKKIEEINNNTVNIVNNMKIEVDKIINQNKEIMKFMLSIKTKLEGY